MTSPENEPRFAMKARSKVKVKRIGLFGGSFDPPHMGHLVIAQQAASQLSLDRIFFIPAHQAPHKLHQRSSESSHRLAMTRLAIKGNPIFRVSDVEIRKKGVSYTIDTLQVFHDEHPGAELFLLIGGDSLEQFHDWRQPDMIRSLASVAVYPRPGNGPAALTSEVRGATIVRGPMLDLSSTEIRRMVNQGKSIRYLVPPDVESYVIRHKLYR